MSDKLKEELKAGDAAAKALVEHVDRMNAAEATMQVKRGRLRYEVTVRLLSSAEKKPSRLPTRG